MENEPSAWIETTAAMYDEMLNALPPRAMGAGAFLVGEPYTYNNNGEAVYACFAQVGRDRFKARYLTVREFRARGANVPA